MTHRLLIKVIKKRQAELKREDNQYAKILASGIYEENMSEQAIKDNRNYCIDIINKYHAIIQDLEDRYPEPKKKGN